MRPGCIVVGALLALSAAWPAGAAQKPKSSEAVWAERIEAGCKADARKYYSAIQFKKRRTFVKHCVDRAYR
jgi:hypothetical protein